MPNCFLTSRPTRPRVRARIHQGFTGFQQTKKKKSTCVRMEKAMGGGGKCWLVRAPPCVSTPQHHFRTLKGQRTLFSPQLFQCQPGDFSSSSFIFRATHEAPSLFLKGLYCIQLFSVYLCGYLWRPEDKLAGVGFLLPLGLQAWWHTPFPSEAWQWPRLLLLAVGVIRFYKKLQTQNISFSRVSR